VFFPDKNIKKEYITNCFLKINIHYKTFTQPVTMRPELIFAANANAAHVINLGSKPGSTQQLPHENK
jgi:hypothetical protein